MNREEILKKSQNEGKGKTDERDQVIAQRSRSISQAIGLLGCLAIAIFADEQYSVCAWTMYCLIVLSENLASAIMYRKSVWRWIAAAVMLIVFVFWLLRFFGIGFFNCVFKG